MYQTSFFRLRRSILLGTHKRHPITRHHGWAMGEIMSILETTDSVINAIAQWQEFHYSDVIMSAMASQTTGVSSVCPNVCSSVDQRKHQSSTSLAFVRGIHKWPVNSSHKGPVTRKMFPCDDVMMSVSVGLWPRSLDTLLKLTSAHVEALYKDRCVMGYEITGNSIVCSVFSR